MKQITTKSGNILCVEVSEDACDKFMRYFSEGLCYRRVVKLSELTDEDCEEFVTISHVRPDGKVNYKDYTNYNKGQHVNIVRFIYEAKESFLSLLQSEGIDTSKEHLIIKVL